jgi:hypothetical protein
MVFHILMNDCVPVPSVFDPMKIADRILQVRIVLPDGGDTMKWFRLSAVLSLLDTRPVCPAEIRIICAQAEEHSLHHPLSSMRARPAGPA